MEILSKNPKKNVQPVIQETQKKSEPKQPEVVEPKPQLTDSQRIEMLEKRLANNEKEIENAFGQLVNRLTPVIKLADNIGKAEEAKKSGVQPVSQGANPLSSIQQLAPILQMFGGATSNPMQEKINELSARLLEKAFEKIAQPSKFEQFFEEEIAKSKAKAMAAAVSS